MAKWSLLENVEDAKKVRVFSGGACNILDGSGNLLRNRERDNINEWLTEKDLIFYDPQIHPDTHEMEYNFDIHYPLEVAARKHSYISLYEISPRTFGGATSLEIAMDEFNRKKPTIIFFSDGKNHEDIIPDHNEKGFPTFKPYGIDHSEVAQKAHYKEFIKNANRMRKYLMGFARDLNALTVTFNEQSYEGDIEITPHRMHAAQLFKAVVNAASGKRTIVNFSGGEEATDSKGNPIMIAPEDPALMQMISYLDQYEDEGNDLRQAICNLVSINVYVRVVYTQKSVINSLEELMSIKKMI